MKYISKFIADIFLLVIVWYSDFVLLCLYVHIFFALTVHNISFFEFISVFLPNSFLSIYLLELSNTFMLEFISFS